MSPFLHTLTARKLVFSFGWVAFSLILLGGFVSSAQAQDATTSSAKLKVHVAVLATRGNVQAQQRWQPTMDLLNQNLPAYHFELIPSNLEQMEDIVKNNGAEFVITNPGQSIMLGWQYPLSWIATLKSPWPNGTRQALGSALIVRSDSRYFNLEDLQNRHAIAVSPDAFGGFLTLNQYLKSQHRDPNQFFKKIDYLGFPIDAMLYHLRDSQADVAIAPVCLLENMEKEGLIERQKFRVINNVPPEGFPCAVSTPLYPNWSLAKTSKSDEALATAVTKVLLSLPKESPAAIAAKSTGWSSPISSLSVEKLYRDLNLHPFQAPWWQQALQWLKEHQQWAWLAVVLFLILNIYHFALEYRFNRNQKLLNQAHEELKQKSQMLEHAQRVAIVGGLGTNLAHEINQPLSAIRNYSQGAKIRIEREADSASVVPILDKIEQQIVRVDEIVQRLRTLITKRAIAKQPLQLADLIHDTIALLKHDLTQKNVNISTSFEGKSTAIFGDPVGLQQVLVNVINNAADSCLSQMSPQSHDIMLKVHYQEHHVDIFIEDNGAGLIKPVEELSTAFVTTKEKGLGLGLSICRDIIDDHNGQFSLSPRQPQGCEVHIQLPINMHR